MITFNSEHLQLL